MQFNEPVFRALSTGIKAKVAAYFLSAPPKMSERETARVLGMSHMSVNRAVNELYALNFLKAARAGRVNLWELNKGSYSHKVIAQLLSTAPDALLPRNALIKTLEAGLKKSGAVSAYMFGSVAKGSEEAGSDIDILIIAGVENDRIRLEKHLSALEEECVRLYGNTLSAIVMTKKELENQRNKAAVKEALKGIKIL